ncbi:MAG: ATP-binding protein [Chlamydiae bacterium]|nr:ATP-binding protein [Chlamydiota bacterium]MBI3278032.1 ATP-binding protein [Chlamydiota bacterium]
MIARRLQPIIVKDLKKKMVFIAGPRQCGKTTLAKSVAKETLWENTYYNWDIDEHRRKLLKNELNASSRLWLLDEIHKFRRWKNWLKGLFDEYHPKHAMLVTGSAMLDAYSRGGDSLQGRYYFHHLHPFTLAELLHPKTPPALEEMFAFQNPVPKSAEEVLKNLLILGGFPEPFSSGSEKEAARWRLSYGTQIIRQEIRSLEGVQDLDKMELLFDRLPAVIGSVLSINSLREDLEVAFETVRNWLKIFERMYAVFRIPPFGPPRIKAVKKEQKLYFWDWARAEFESQKLENLVASHLLRFVHWREDVEGEKWELRFFRDVVGHEVDFILLRKGKPWCAIEVKTQERPLDPNLKYLLERTQIPYAFQISLKGNSDWEPPKINGTAVRIMPAAKFLANLV